MRSERPFLIFALVIMGAGWGATIPLTKYIVSHGFEPFGVLFWQLFTGAVLLGALTFLRRKPLPLAPKHIALYSFVGLCGTLIPGFFSITATQYLPAGIMALVISTVPMFAFPIALLIGQDVFSLKRFLGLGLGLAAVGLITVPEVSLPERAMISAIPIALIAPICYAIEGNVVAKIGTLGVGPIRVLLGAFIFGTIIVFPIAIVSGQWISPFAPLGLPHAAIVLSAAIHAIVYGAYVWLVGRSGSVFASQVAYLVTGFGLLWSIVFLGESFSVFVWLALGLMFAGIFLVQPRDNADLDQTPSLPEDSATKMRPANQ